MVRSGSTWSFNIVKQLLLRTGSALRSGYSDAVGDALLRHGEAERHVVIKSHWPDKLGRALIRQGGCRTIYTYREPLEAILSFSTVEAATGQRLERPARLVKASLDLMRFQVEAGGVKFVWYDDIVERGHEVVQSIADYLGLALEPGAIGEVADALSRDNVRRIIKQLSKSGPQVRVGAEDWDGGTLFSSKHVRDAPADPASVFNAAQIAEVAETLGDYVGADAALRPAIRVIGALDGATPSAWPSTAPSAPTTLEAEPPVAEAAVAAADDEPPEAPPIADEAPPEPPIAAAVAPPSVAAAPAAPPAAIAKAAPAKTSAKTSPVKPAPIKPAPKPQHYDPVRDAARRALARDLMSSLGHLPRGKPRTRVSD